MSHRSLDLPDILAVLAGARHLADARHFAKMFKDQLDSFEPGDWGRFLNMYVDFNRHFAGGPLLLAGQLHMQSDLHCETSQNLVCAVLRAVTDEFPLDRPKDTHVMLAERFGVAALTWFGAAAPAELLVGLREAVLNGYDIGPGDPTSIARALGFHLATEMNGVVEFGLLDSVLRAKCPQFVAAAGDGQPRTAYEWISKHRTLEKARFRSALEGVSIIRSAFGEDIDAAIDLGVRQFYRLATSALILIRHE